MYLMPVWWIWLCRYLVLNPRQVDSDESFEALTVTTVSREWPTVVHQCVHPVFIDELKWTHVEILDGSNFSATHGSGTRRTWDVTAASTTPAA